MSKEVVVEWGDIIMLLTGRELLLRVWLHLALAGDKCKKARSGMDGWMDGTGSIINSVLRLSPHAYLSGTGGDSVFLGCAASCHSRADSQAPEIHERTSEDDTTENK